VDVAKTPIEYRCWTKGEEKPENGGDATAPDAEEAAEKYAEDYFNAYAESPTDLVVFVRDPAGAVTKWLVEAEYTVNFYAREMKPTPFGDARTPAPEARA
jgi:hypothetical protein